MIKDIKDFTTNENITAAVVCRAGNVFKRRKVLAAIRKMIADTIKE